MTNLQAVPSPGPGTETRILEALADVVINDGVAGFTVQAVADRAGVSHRTVYRYFPSREALLEGLTEHLDDWMRAEGMPGIPLGFGQLLDSIEVVYGFFEDHAAMVEAMVVVGLTLGIEPGRRRERTAGFVDMVRRESPNLGLPEVRRWAMALRSIASSQHWHTLRRRYQLEFDQAVLVTRDSLEALIAGIRSRNTKQAANGDSG